MRKLYLLILGGFLFISLTVGGGIAWLFNKFYRTSNVGLAIFCGGLLAGILLLDIIPGALSMYEPTGIILGSLLGYLFYRFINQFHSTAKPDITSIYLLMLGIFIHTIPLSFVIGQLLNNSPLVATITTATIFHHIPEGFVLTSAFLWQRKKLSTLILCFITLSICFVTFIWLGQHVEVSTRILGMLIGVSISLIAFISIKELILHNRQEVPFHTFLNLLLGGLFIGTLIHLFL